MPVPVSTFDRHPTHQVTKSRGVIQGAFPSVAADDASRYVIQPACQPAAAHTAFAPPSNSQEAHTNWSSSIPFSSGENSKLASFFSRPQVAQESLGFQRGLITAGDAVINKQAYAEAYCSPDTFSATMGLQHFSDRSRSSESTWKSYEAGNAACAAGFASRCDAWNSDRVNGHPVYYTSDTYMDAEHPPAYELAEQLCDNLLQTGATPFSDFVDRIVASEATHMTDYPSQDTLETHLPVETSGLEQRPVSVDLLSDPTYIRAYRTMAEPVSDWMADYVWKVCTAGMSLPRRFVGVGTSRYFPEKPPSGLAKSIHAVLCSTLLQPSAIVLAVWYMTRLPVFFDGHTAGCDFTLSEQEFRKELFGEGCFYSAAGERNQLENRAPFRVALLGCMLANKWLDDHTFSNKTWQTISDEPIQSINKLELTALVTLEHDLSVSPKAWAMWLSQLQQYHLTSSPYPAPIGRPSASDSQAIIRKMVVDLTQLHNQIGGPKASARTPWQPIFSPLLQWEAEKKAGVYPVQRFDPFEIDLDEDGPLREEYVPKRRSSRSMCETYKRSASIDANNTIHVSQLLPPPSEWSPQADPPLHREVGRRGSHLPTTTVGGNASHGRSQSFAYPQAAWETQARPEFSAGSFLSHQADARGMSPKHGFQPMSFGFPANVVCPPTSNARAALQPTIPSGQSNGHVRSYSQSLIGGNENISLPPISCSQYRAYPSAYSHGQADHGHFRPLWLRA